MLFGCFGNFERIAIEVENPPFKEIYDYDLDKVGLSDVIRNKISEMPIYVILRLLTFTILYNDDELFDGIFKSSSKFFAIFISYS